MKKLSYFYHIVMIIMITGIVIPSALANFQLETMTVILDASEPRKVFSIKNLSKEPILLSTKVNDIEGGDALANDILISPPIIRIDPGQSQQINFLLKKGVHLSHEAILRVSFQGIGAAKSDAMKMPIRQDIAMLVIPEGMMISQTPWKSLSVKQHNNKLTIKNTGKQVIRLSPNIITLPDNKIYDLEQFYLRPDESKTLLVSGKVDTITLSPLSRYGFKMPQDVNIKVQSL